MFEDFKKFAMRGNVVDMAVGIVLGTAFGKIVSSFVSDVLMPPIGLLMGDVDFSKLIITLKEKTAETAAVTLNYGVFINTLIDFIIIAFAIYMVIRQMNKLMPKEEAPVTTKKCDQCLSEVPLEAKRCAHCTSTLDH